MNLAGRNHLCGRKKQAGDESGRKKSSLRKKKASWGCICPIDIIPAEEKSELGMNLAGRNHPCGRKKQAGDAFVRSTSSLRKKKASWGLNRAEEIIPAEQKSKLGMKPGRRNHPCGRKKQAGDESDRKKSSLRRKRASLG